MTQDRSQSGWRSSRGCFLVILTLIYAISFIDRSIFNILIDPIKKDLGASDAVMGLLAGFAFVVMHALVAFPIARLADRGNRQTILASGIVLWSGATMASGIVGSISQLAVARVAVGIGESVNTTAHSLIADLYSKAIRARALSVYSCGLYLGVFLGYFIGGHVGQTYGWRAAFFVAALPGLLFAALVLLLRAPTRGGADATERRATGQVSIRKTLDFMLRQPSLLWVVAGFCLTSYANFALGVWLPAFMGRVHHMSGADIGTYVGLIKGVVPMVGILLGGVVVDRLIRRDDAWILRAPAISSLIGAVALFGFLFIPTSMGSLAALAITGPLIAFQLGPIFAFIQTVVPPAMRSFSIMCVTVLTSFLGLGAGSALVGAISDALVPVYGAQSIRYALLTTVLANTLGGLCFLMASRHVFADFGRAELQA